MVFNIAQNLFSGGGSMVLRKQKVVGEIHLLFEVSRIGFSRKRLVGKRDGLGGERGVGVVIRLGGSFSHPEFGFLEILLFLLLLSGRAHVDEVEWWKIISARDAPHLARSNNWC